MLKVKGNYKNGFPDQTCRACKKNPETQKHVLHDCEKLHPEASTSNKNLEKSNTNKDLDTSRGEETETIDFFTEDPTTLKATAKNIEKIMENLLDDSSDTRC